MHLPGLKDVDERVSPHGKPFPPETSLEQFLLVHPILWKKKCSGMAFDFIVWRGQLLGQFLSKMEWLKCLSKFPDGYISIRFSQCPVLLLIFFWSNLHIKNNQNRSHKIRISWQEIKWREWCSPAWSDDTANIVEDRKWSFLIWKDFQKS